MYINEDAVKSSKRLIYIEFLAGTGIVVFWLWLNLVVETGYTSLFNLFIFPWTFPLGICAIKRCLILAEFENYRPFIGMKPMMSLIDIAKKMAKNPEDVLRDFEWLNANNIFEDTYLDSQNYRIYFGNRPYGKSKKELEEMSKEKRMIAHVCKYCGGVTMVEKGKDGICDWCRGPIESKEGTS